MAADAPLYAADIPWQSSAQPRVETLDVEELLALDPGELLAYAQDCREALQTERAVLREAIEILAAQRAQLLTAARVVESQRQQLRDWRSAA